MCIQLRKAEPFHDGLEVSKPTLQEVSKPELQEVSKLTPQEVPKSALHEVAKTTPQEVSKSTPLKNKTEINNTELSNIESNHISSSSVEVKQKGAQGDEMRCDTMGSSSSVNSLAADYRSLICRNIEFDKGAADGHSEAVPLSGAFNHIDILVFAR